MLETQEKPCTFEDVQDVFKVLKECRKHLDYYLSDICDHNDKKYTDAINFFREHSQDNTNRKLAEMFDEDLKKASPLYLAYLAMQEETSRMSVFGLNYKQDIQKDPDITISSYGKKSDLFQRIPLEDRQKLATVLTQNGPRVSL